MLVDGNHPVIISWKTCANLLGFENCELLFGRSFTCDLLNEPSKAGNRIFRLRAVGKNPLKYLSIASITPVERARIERMGMFWEGGIPQGVSRFRVCRDEKRTGFAFLEDDFEQRSRPCPESYFRCGSSATFKRRSYGLGMAGWCGSDALLGPFLSYCGI